MLGLVTRLAAIPLCATMFVAAFLRHHALQHLLVALGAMKASEETVRSWGNPELALVYLVVFSVMWKSPTTDVDQRSDVYSLGIVLFEFMAMRAPFGNHATAGDQIKVLEEPKSGFLGMLGGRPARVLVRKKRGRRGGKRQDHRRALGPDQRGPAR